MYDPETFEHNNLQVSLVYAQVLEKQLTSRSNHVNNSMNNLQEVNQRNILRDSYSYNKNLMPMVRVYIYIDGAFFFKTEIFGQTNYTIIDLKLKISLPADAQEIRFDMYDASNLSNEQITKLKQQYKSEWDPNNYTSHSEQKRSMKKKMGGSSVHRQK